MPQQEMGAGLRTPAKGNITISHKIPDYQKKKDSFMPIMKSPFKVVIIVRVAATDVAAIDATS